MIVLRDVNKLIDELIDWNMSICSVLCIIVFSCPVYFLSARSVCPAFLQINVFNCNEVKTALSTHEVNITCTVGLGCINNSITPTKDIRLMRVSDLE